MKQTVQTWLVMAGYLLFLLFCLLAFPFVMFIKLFLSRQAYRRLIHRLAAWWARMTLRFTGSRVSVGGRELIPSGQPLCFVGNHQGMFDIPAFLGHVGRPAGFIAKQELFKVPVISLWMKQIPCVFIDRKSSRKARESFQHSVALIQSGHPLVIFPEGTRSRSDHLGQFRPGALKLPLLAGATIVPFAIKGSWRVFEIDKRIHKTTIQLRFLPPIPPEDPIYKDKQALPEHLHELIRTALERM